MRSLLITLLAIVLASCSSAPTLNTTDRSNVLSDIQFIQNGRVVEPVNGVVSLMRSPFYIRYKGKGLRPSVFASTNPKVKAQHQQLRNPLVSWSGTGSAAYPSELYVSSDQLSLYDGWSQQFEKDWGKIFEKEDRVTFSNFRNQLSAEPLLISSGRNYANFVPQSDGSHIYAVSRINGKAISETRYRLLHLILFADNAPVSREVVPYILHWASVDVAFIDS